MAPGRQELNIGDSDVDESKYSLSDEEQASSRLCEEAKVESPPCHEKKIEEEPPKKSRASAISFKDIEKILVADLVDARERRKAVAICKGLKAKLEAMERSLGSRPQSKEAESERSSLGEERRRAKQARLQYRKVKRCIRNGAATQIQRAFLSSRANSHSGSEEKTSAISSKRSSVVSARRSRGSRRSTKGLLRENPS